MEIFERYRSGLARGGDQKIARGKRVSVRIDAQRGNVRSRFSACISRTSLMAQRCSERALPDSTRRWRQFGDHRSGLLYGNHRRGEHALNRLRHSAAEQFMLIDLVVNAVEIRTANDLAGVQERGALAFRDIPIALAEENGLFLAALEHFRIVG